MQPKDSASSCLSLHLALLALLYSLRILAFGVRSRRLWRLKMQKAYLKTCFISAPVKVDTFTLRKALESRGVRWSDASAAKPGTSILNTIESAIEGADFVCVVLPTGFENKNVLFEMGLARGLKRPLLVFLGEGASIPWDLQGFAYARTRLADEKSVNFHL